MRPSAEHVLVTRIFEDARRAAVEQNRDLLHLFGYRRDGQAVAARDVADDEIDIAALDQIAVLAHLLGGTTRLVDDHQLHRRAAEALGVVRRRRLARVQGFDDGLGRQLGRHAERPGRGPGEEGDETDADGLAVVGMSNGCHDPQQCQREQARQPERAMAHGRLLQRCFIVGEKMRKNSPAGSGAAGQPGESSSLRASSQARRAARSWTRQRSCSLAPRLTLLYRSAASSLAIIPSA